MDAFDRYMLQQGFSATTRRHYRKVIELARRAGLDSIPAEEVLLRMVASRSPGTWQSYRSALTAWERAHGRNTELPRTRVPKGLPRPVDQPIVDRYLEASRGPRDRVLQGLLVFAGLRISEAANLRWASVTSSALWITGKGGKEREVPIHPELALALSDWRWRTSGPWVLPGPAGDAITTLRLRQIHYELCDRAGVPRFVPHRARHTFATEALRICGDITIVRDLLGHSSVATTEIYTHVLRGKHAAVVGRMYGDRGGR